MITQGLGQGMSAGAMAELFSRQYPRYRERAYLYYRNEDLCRGIPSHGFDHHERVCFNSLNLALLMAGRGVSFESHFIISLIIASLFHDTGLTNVIGKMHGEEGARISLKFMEAEGVNEKIAGQVAEAIRYHDDKRYLEHHPPSSLASVVSVADDVDSFGYTGICRHIAISLKRGLDPESDRDQILINASLRHSNLQRVYGYMGEFARQQRERYLITERFFSGNRNPDRIRRREVIEMIRGWLLSEPDNLYSLTNRSAGIISDHKASFSDYLREELAANITAKNKYV